MKAVPPVLDVFPYSNIYKTNIVAFILLNNSGVTIWHGLFNARFHVLHGPRPQDAGTPLLLSVLTSELDSGPGKGLHQQSNLPWSLNRPWLQQFLSLTLQCNCSACNVPPTQGYKKSHLFHTNPRTPKSKDMSRQNRNFQVWYVVATLPLLQWLYFPLRAHNFWYSW
jgi:hypothetical protein